LVKLFKEQTMPQFSDDLFLGPAQGYQGTGSYASVATFTGSIATTVLTVTEMLSGDPIVVGMYVDNANISTGTYITAFGGTGAGGVGTYTVNNSQTSSSATVIAAGNALAGNPAPMSLGVGPLGRVYVFDVVPQTLDAANIAASQTPTGTSVTLTAGGSVKSVVRADGVTVLQLDCPRALSVTLVVGGTARAYTISGFDYYGQAMSEVITSVAAATTNGKKAFYQISGVTGAGGSVTAITIGTTQLIGLPVRVTDAGYIGTAGWDNTLARNAGTLAVAATVAATTTTGDVRGTYSPSSAPDGIKRLVLGILLPGIAVGPNATRVGAFGVTQA
jgi:hypothetical protein